MLKNDSKIYVLIFLIGLNYACSAEGSRYELLDNFSIPAEAQSVKKLYLGSEYNQQILFNIETPYRPIGIQDFYYSQFTKNGWVRCVGVSDDWIFFQDITTKPQQDIHQKLVYWVKPNEKRLAMLSFRYYSNKYSREKPENNRLSVILLVQQNVDIESELLELSLTCEAKESR